MFSPKRHCLCFMVKSCLAINVDDDANVDDVVALGYRESTYTTTSIFLVQLKSFNS